MSAVPKPFLTPQEYLARERRAGCKHEYYRGTAYPPLPSGRDHDLVRDNFALAAGNGLLASPYRVVTGATRVKVAATGLYAYPDILVPDADPVYEDDYRDTLLNPLAIVEVLSDASTGYDLGTKFHHYGRVPSLREYVVVCTDEPTIQRYVRRGDNEWLLSFAKGVGATVEFLAAAPVRVPLVDVYRGLTFSDTPDYEKLAAAGIFRSDAVTGRRTDRRPGDIGGEP